MALTPKKPEETLKEKAKAGLDKSFDSMYAGEPAPVLGEAGKLINRGVRAGARETLGSFAGTAGVAGGLLQDLSGGLVGQGLEKAGYKAAGEQFQKAEELAKDVNVPTLTEAVDSADPVTNFAKWATYNVAKLTPMAASAAFGGGAGSLAARATAGQGLKAAARVAGQRAAKGIARPIDKAAVSALRGRMNKGAKIGAGLTSAGIEIGSVGHDIVDRTGQPDPWTALKFGTVAGALDVLPEFRIIDKLMPGKKGSALKEGLTQAGFEGITEAGQTAAEEAGVQSAHGQDWLDKESLKKIFDPAALIESAAVGALGGTVLGGGTQALQNKLQEGKQGDWVVQDPVTGTIRKFRTETAANKFAERKGLPIDEVTVFNTSEVGDASKDEKTTTVHGDVRQEQTASENVSGEEGGKGVYETGPQKEEGLESYIGEKANLAEIGVGATEQAQRALDAGVDSESLRQTLGWFKGPEEKWRYEIDDSKVDWTDQGKNDSYQTLPLKKVIQHPTLLKAYPEFQEITVKFDPNETSGKGVFDPTEMTITLSTKDRGKQKGLDTLIHEIQHAIQVKEDFDKGTSPEFEQEQIYKKLPKEQQQELNRAVQIKKHPENYSSSDIENAQVKLNDLASKGFKRYWTKFGEFEARDAAERRTLTKAQRREAVNPPYRRYKDEKPLWIAREPKHEMSSDGKYLFGQKAGFFAGETDALDLQSEKTSPKEQNLGFYSGVEKAVQNLPQEKGQGRQILRTLEKMPEVKKEELEYMGVPEFLEGRKNVTKQELADFVKQGGVKLVEFQNMDTLSPEFQKMYDARVQQEIEKARNVEEQKLGRELTEGEKAELEIRIEYNKGSEIEQDLMDELNIEKPKFQDVVLPGKHEGYKELLLTMPNPPLTELPKGYEILEEGEEFFLVNPERQIIASGKDQAQLKERALSALSDTQPEFYDEHHFNDVPNIVAHARTTLRPVDGKQTLFVEEVQSDLHQEGKKKGYQGTSKDGVVDLPFKKSWPELMMKRLITYVQEQGIDQIAWTSGEMQADRYKLRHVVDKVQVAQETGNSENLIVKVDTKNSPGLSFNVDGKTGEILTESDAQFEGKTLDQVVGKELAQQILERGRKEGKDKVVSFEGEDLDIGGEGLKTFYNKELVNKMNKFLKKFGGKVQVKEVETTDGKKEPVWSFEVPEKLKEQMTEEGIALFSEKKGKVEVSRSRVEGAVEKVLGKSAAKELMDSGFVQVLTKEEFQERFGVDPDRVQGLFSNKSKSIFLHEGTVNPEAVLVHEGTHASLTDLVKEQGLELLLGDSYWVLQRDLDQLIESGDPLAKEAQKRAMIGLQSAMKRGQKDADMLTQILMQERLAYYGELARGKKTPLARKIIAKTKAWVLTTPFGKRLAEKGIFPKLDDATVVELARMAVLESAALKETYKELMEKNNVREKETESVLLSEGDIEARPGASLGRMAQLLGPQLYGNIDEMTPTTVKEVYQNSFDAVKGALEEGKITRGKIKIDLDESARTIKIQDNGNGMTPEIIQGAFLTIAGTDKNTSRPSGGLGIAKMLFLFGSERLNLTTVHDGKKYTLETSGPELLAALDDPSKFVKIKSSDTNEPNGTLLEVQIPRTYQDPSTGESKSIHFTSFFDPPTEIVDGSPLFENIDVVVDGEKKSVGSEFPVNDFVPLATVKFDWGTARILVSKAKEEKFGENMIILSNGLKQFGKAIKENPWDFSSKNIPRQMFVNVEPDVRPEDSGYPFALNRQDFSPAVKKDFEKIFNYISALYGGSEAAEVSAGFGETQQLLGTDRIGEPVKLMPDQTEVTDKQQLLIDEGSVIEVVDGRVKINGREVPELSPEDMANFKVDLDTFRIPQEDVDPNVPLLHNNTLVEVRDDKKIESLGEEIARLEKESDENFARWNALDSEAKKKSRDLWDKHVDLEEKIEMLKKERRRLRRKAMEQVDLVQHLQDKFGKPRLNRVFNRVGGMFKELRDAVVELKSSDGTLWWEELRKVPVGLSFDQQYRGVHTWLPFQAMFVNPAITKYTDPQRAAMGIYTTMVHEMAHHNVRSHDASFVDELQTILIALSASEKMNTARFVKNLAALIHKNKDIFDYMNEVFTDGYVTNIGRSFQNDEVTPRDASLDRNRARVAGTRFSGTISEGTEGNARRAGRSEGEQKRQRGSEEVEGDFLESFLHYNDTHPEPVESGWKDMDYILYQVQDKLRYLYKKQKELGNVPPDQDAYMAEILYHGRVQDRIRKFQQGTRDPLLEKITESGLDIEQVDEWFLARHAHEANERLRRINAKRFLREAKEGLDDEQRRRINRRMRQIKKEGGGPFHVSRAYMELLQEELEQMPKEWQDAWQNFSEKPSGMSDQKATRVLKEREGNKALEEVGRRFDVMNRESIITRLRAGLLTEEEAQVLLNTYKHWAPLKRKGFDDKFRGKGRGASLGRKEFGLRAGSGKEVDKILANAIAASEASIIRAEKQKIGETLLALVKENPDPAFWRVDTEKPMPQLDSDGSIAMYPNLREKDNEVIVKMDGVPHKIIFEETNDHAWRIAHALKNLDNSSGAFINGLSYVNRWLSMVNTSLSPEFLVTNFLRDLQTAQFNLGDTEAKELRGKILKDTLSGAAWKGMKGHLEGRIDDEWSRWADDFAAQGGMTGWVENYKSIKDVETKLKNQMEMIKPTSSWSATKRGLKGIFDVVQEYNTATENAIRLATYKALVEAQTDATTTPEELADVKKKAARVAKELTTNFNKKGAAGQAINALYLFANAGIQGNMRMLRALRYSPETQVMVAATVTAAALMSAANRMLGGDDEDGIPYYDKIPSWIKERNMVFMVPGGEGKFVKIPLPWGYNVFWVLGDQIGSSVTSPRFTPIEGASTVGMSLLGAFSPMQGGTIAQAISPTISDPGIQILENKTFTGATLKPEGNPFAKIPPPEHTLYWSSARKPSVKIAKMLSNATGGDDIVGGKLDWSPEWFDLAWDTVGGSAARFISDTGLLVEGLLKDGTLPEEERNIPFLRRVYGKTNNSVDKQLYRERVKQVWASEKRFKKHGEKEAPLQLVRLTRKVEKKLKQIAEAKKRTGTEERKKQLELRADRLRAAFNKEWRKRVMKKEG